MKKFIFLLLLAIPQLFWQCNDTNRNESNISNKESKTNQIAGTWQLVESWYSIGGPEITTTKVKDSEEIFTFKNNGSYVTTAFQCNPTEKAKQKTGNYSLETKKIFYTPCEGTPQESLTFELKDGFLFTYPSCTESCGNKYKRVQD